jgi:hypothetical protein
VKAVPQIGIVLGNETKTEGHAFVDSAVDSADKTPIGVVRIELTGAGYLGLQATSADVLLAMEAAFHEAGQQLRGLIALGSLQKSARVSTAPGADALDEAAPATAAEGERLDYSVVTGSALCPRTGDPVAAPPSNPKRPTADCTCVPGEGTRSCPYEIQCYDEWWLVAHGGAL